MRKYQKGSTFPQVSLGFSSNKTGFIRQLRRRSGVGFTLIELLVVIAILGVLATVLIVIINPAQKLASARDAGRKSALKQIRSALDAYAVNHGGSYPNPAVWPDWGWTGSSRVPWLQDLINSGDIKVAPKDPLETDDPEYHYYYKANLSSGSDYCIMLAFETVPTTDPNFFNNWANSNKFMYNSKGTIDGECGN